MINKSDITNIKTVSFKRNLLKKWLLQQTQQPITELVEVTLSESPVNKILYSDKSGYINDPDHWNVL